MYCIIVITNERTSNIRGSYCVFTAQNVGIKIHSIYLRSVACLSMVKAIARLHACARKVNGASSMRVPRHGI